MNNEKREIIILGGGLTGLTAGYVITNAGHSVKVFESDSTVGGLSKTVIHGGFRFDLGGHRFFTTDKKIDDFVKKLMDKELISVCRSSKILLQNKFFDYPLRPLNAMFGLGLLTTLRIIADYGVEKVRKLIKETDNISLEDWVISNFGRTMFDIYFKEYSEKVWGIECSRISADWVSQRIKGLSLAKAVKNAFFKFSGKDLPTLADRFLYPELGIGRISDRLKEEIEAGNNSVLTDSRIERINHSDFKVESIVVKHLIPPHPPLADKNESGDLSIINGNEFISSIPITKLIQMLNPAPPKNILDAASKLKFRDLIIVAIMVKRKRVTDQTWIYIPEKKIPFGRIHEPTNWSEKMAPEGNTIIVMEYFSFVGDRIWNDSDKNLVDITTKNLEDLGFIKRHEIINGCVVRVPKAYPLFEIGYKKLCDEIYDYLSRFKNLHISGRSGMFKYYNMDHAIESGMQTAEKIKKQADKHGDERMMSLQGTK